MSGIGREALMCGQKVLPYVRELSLGHHGGRETHPDVREWLGGPFGCPEVVGRTSRWS